MGAERTATTLVTRRPDDPAPRRHLVHRIVDPLRWDETHERLAAQPAFRGCSRGEVRTLARAGDECLVPAGTVLCHEDRIGYWFFVVVEGALRLSQKGEDVATLGPGSHVGEVAILGFGPQPMTVTAVVDSTVFVLGRRHLIDLTYAMTSLQRGLFPDVAADRFQAKVRELRQAGAAAWKLVPREVAEAAAGTGGELLPVALRTFPSRASTSIAPAFGRLFTPRGPGGADASATARSGPGSRAVPAPVSRRAVVAAAVVLVALVAWFGFAFHPGVLIARPGSSLDVSEDVTVRGLPTRPPAGRYLLTVVHIEEPNLFGAAAAVVGGEELLPGLRGDALVENRRAGRTAYRRSQEQAVAVIARRAGVDPGTVDVAFRDRGLAGPSAGLLYALLLADVTGQVDVEEGRVIAATGMLGEDGRVLPVGFVGLKRQVAQRASADVFFVPAPGGDGSAPSPSSSASASVGGLGDGGRMRSVEVATVEEALRRLASPGPAGTAERR